MACANFFGTKIVLLNSDSSVEGETKSNAQASRSEGMAVYASEQVAS
jgi:hypothetical protein